jgi:hypothetical protein
MRRAEITTKTLARDTRVALTDSVSILLDLYLRDWPMLSDLFRVRRRACFLDLSRTASENVNFKK